MLDEQIGPVRTVERSPCGAITLAHVAERARVGIFSLERRAGVADLSSMRPSSRNDDHGNAEFGSRVRRLSTIRRHRGDGFETSRRDGDAGLGHHPLKPGKLRVVANAIREKPVAARHRPFEAARNRAIGGIEAEDQTIEKTPPLATRDP